jgi:galactokinase/mevalonate kinase-like predicted kinase
LINALRKYSLTCRSENNTINEKKENLANSGNGDSVVDQLIDNAIQGGELVHSFAEQMETTYSSSSLLPMIDEFLDQLGATVNRYWDLKIAMAKGSNPPHIARILNELKPLSVGLELTGAGGGGFVFIILKKELHKQQLVEKVNQIQNSLKNSNSHNIALAIHNIAMDNHGLQSEEIPVQSENSADLSNFLS